jgi:hypothetical protein
MAQVFDLLPLDICSNDWTSFSAFVLSGVAQAFEQDPNSGTTLLGSNVSCLTQTLLLDPLSPTPYKKPPFVLLCMHTNNLPRLFTQLLASEIFTPNLKIGAFKTLLAFWIHDSSLQGPHDSFDFSLISTMLQDTNFEQHKPPIIQQIRAYKSKVNDSSGKFALYMDEFSRLIRSISLDVDKKVTFLDTSFLEV